MLSRAVVNRRHDPPDSLNYFPTPPFATRALCNLLACEFGPLADLSAWDPACGEGHMAAVLLEYFSSVEASDVFPYGYGGERDFLGGLHVAPPPCVDWIITNPPFSTALEFADRALEIAARGVALLVRSNWLEGEARYRDLFRCRPPTLIAQFVERVPMLAGRWDPEGGTATAYSWVIWRKPTTADRPAFVWIPPGQRKRLTFREDLERFAAVRSAPLLEALT
jgi:hypothetical protein